ncbi:short-chain dehydrogenase/reductase family protein [Dictyostelium discoideum AX4]|uniref:Short-chain dehydrogenase/reductase family protein n=1 Tax=Dictyostelium discoideum TaxID=44689 RepID=Q54PM9_DICDI|nr:short-chain dehydrogenase/reductase family protein [Dictyostelium discoideum AX4]EAL65263.1 short-chain dehydrogenase/reductase family protein [Dictyostelium discoideum AX4]|eukprot:XP_638625.1 short-chain dehydrogenase/reductase family protein [Dictyostelium discoideum AX4]
MESIENNNTNKTWIVTGTSSGIGLELVKKLLKNGFKVSALTRKPEEIENQVKQINFENGNLLIVKTDITNDESVKNAVKKTVEKFGKIDVLVNNAGYGLVGSIEELTDLEFRKIYDVNVFGVLHLLRHTTPYFRNQRSGTIINISSQMGWDNMENYSAYSSTKHAVNSITLSIQKELKPFNVNVILVSPGGFRTGFVVGQQSNFQIPSSFIEEYKTNSLIELFNKYSPLSRGNPEKAADLLIKLSTTDKLPNNLFLGTDSLTAAKKQLESHLLEAEKWSELSISTDY